MSKQLETIKIMLDYLQGPIWLSDIESGDPNTGISVVDNDPIVKELNYKCAELFNGYYEFDSHDQACWFNHEKEKADKLVLLDLITRLVFVLMKSTMVHTLSKIVKLNALKCFNDENCANHI